MKQSIIELLGQTKGLNVSDKYKPISTIDVLNKLCAQGFEIDQVSTTNARSHAGYQKHLVRLSHPDFTLNRSDVKPQILLYNSYNKSCPLTFKLGLFRFVCANGLEVGNSYYSASNKHLLGIDAFLTSAIDSMYNQLNNLTNQINNFSETELSYHDTQVLLNNILRQTVFKDVNPIRIVTDILNPQRDADEGSDLFTVLNIIQERIIRGGIKYQTVIQDQGTFKIKNNTTRAIKSIDRTQDYNVVVMDEALKLNNLKKVV
jgi:hypothetical protein